MASISFHKERGRVMESYLYPDHYDLVTPDGYIKSIKHISEDTAKVTVLIENISPAFVGFQIDLDMVFFNLKSVLAQLGMTSTHKSLHLDSKRCTAEVELILIAIDDFAKQTLPFLEIGLHVGKLFAADERRRVRDPDYLSRMFGRSDKKGRPLLSLGGMNGSSDLCLEKVDGRTIAYLTVKRGKVVFDDAINGFIPTIMKSLKNGPSLRELLKLHQYRDTSLSRTVKHKEVLLVQTLPLHIRTVFARVASPLLVPGYHHTSASILQPDTTASGDIYELYGQGEKEISDIPLEFYTLEPHREHVFFSDRDQLQSCLEDPATLFKAFKTAPSTPNAQCAVFVVKGKQMLNLKQSDWIVREPLKYDFPGIAQSSRQALMVDRYIDCQASYPFLKAIEDGLITSQGVLLLQYFPSPLLKRLLLSTDAQRCLKGIYFRSPSSAHGEYFSQEDRAFLLDLAKFAIPVYWVDEISGRILQYIQKHDKDYGMFVPIENVTSFLKATVFGIYGSNLMEGNFEEELLTLFNGIIEMKDIMDHSMLNSESSLALVTGGGPGAMEVGNRVAKKLGILSCANIVDFRKGDGTVVNEQNQNPHIDAKMTYRLEKLVERQAEFHLHFPIFLPGGIGTDFEFALEEVRRKVGIGSPTPVMLFGPKEYWNDKITHAFRCNMKSGTIAGSEWISNCFYCINNAMQGLDIYRQYFQETLAIGPDAPISDEGFITVE